MRIKKVIAILALGALVSCQSKESLNLSPVPSDSEGAALEARTSDTPLTYLADVDHDAWVSLVTLDERIEACNPTQEELDRMSDKALAESIAHYPLNHLILTYNDPEDFIRVLAEKSTLHQEFVKRQNGADALVDLLDGATLRMETDAVRTKGSELSFGEEMFLEHFAATKDFQSSLSEAKSRKLESFVKSKFIERMSEPETFSDESLRPLLKMEAAPVLTPDVPEITQDALLGTSVIYTLEGHYLSVRRYSELSQYEINYITNSLSSDYPNATVVSPASARYNCHSYAWYSRSTSNPYWINAMNDSGVLQLSRYWTNDAYASCTESQAEFIYYANGDHSAVMRPDGKYISKWGKGPVMIHNATYCPYNTSGRQYYRTKPYLPENTLRVSCSSNQSTNQLTTGVDYYFHIDTYNPSVTYQWSLESHPSGPNPVEPTIIGTTTGTGTVYCVIFNTPGYYVVRADAYGTKPDGSTVNINFGRVSCVAIPPMH